jgi:type IV pilus assembly protein PilF
MVTVTLLFGLISCSSNSAKKMRQADLYFGAGTQSLMNQDYTDALTNLLKANELNPNHSGILNNLGMAYYFKGERDLAVSTLNKSLNIDADNSDAKVNLASIYFNDGQYDKAEKVYKNVLKDLTYDKQPRTYYNLGLLELRKKKRNEALSYFKKSVKEDPNYCPSLYQIGLMHYEEKQFSDSLKSFKDATMGTCFESPAPHFYQALSLIGLKRFNEARVKLNEVETRFGKTEFGEKSRRKMNEIEQIEQNNMSESFHASRKMLESPDF